MAILLKVDGTLQAAFAVGNRILKNDPTDGLQIWDGTSLETLQVATPASNDDAATKDYVDTATGGLSTASSSKSAQGTHVFGDGAATFSTTLLVPQSSVCFKVVVNIKVAYNAGTTISAGYAATPTDFFSLIDATSVDTLIFEVIVEQQAAAQAFMLTVTNAGGLSAGELDIYYTYVETLSN